jgi:hypothetical protein
VLKKHLHLHPPQDMHELKERETVKRLKFCRWFRDVITAKREKLLDVTFFTDEGWFHLTGYTHINSQNSRVSSETNRMNSRIRHYMIRKLVCGAPYHEIE